MQLITEILKFFPYLAGQAELLHQIVNTHEPVLLSGPTGAGKSRLARLIHDVGLRGERKCSTINLAEISANLFESELFGHVKGSFTNAISDHVGLIEETDNGDLVIEDISEMPLELQAKFLRFLDEQTIRRIGSTKMTQVNVRLIMTTNRNLRQEVANNRFRSDLYHRLINGWHLELPSLTQVPLPSLQQVLDNLIHDMRKRYHTVVSGNGRLRYQTKFMTTMAANLDGNYRTLQLVARILAFSPHPVFKLADLPPELFPDPNASIAMTPLAGSALWKSRLGEMLRQERIKRGWSLRETAREADIHHSQSGEIGQLERGTCWYWPMFFKLMRAYGLSLAPVPVRQQAEKSQAGGKLDHFHEQPSLHEAELAHIQDVLNDCHGNRTEAARRLGISQRTLRNKLGRKDLS